MSLARSELDALRSLSEAHEVSAGDFRSAINCGSFFDMCRMENETEGMSHSPGFPASSLRASGKTDWDCARGLL
mgnify:CR=1 FL=1